MSYVNEAVVVAVVPEISVDADDSQILRGDNGVASVVRCGILSCGSVDPTEALPERRDMLVVPRVLRGTGQTRKGILRVLSLLVRIVVTKGSVERTTAKSRLEHGVDGVLSVQDVLLAELVVVQVRNEIASEDAEIDAGLSDERGDRVDDGTGKIVRNIAIV